MCHTLIYCEIYFQFMKNRKLKGQGGIDLNSFLVLGVSLVAFLLVITSLTTSLPAGSATDAGNNVTQMFTNISLQLPVVGTIVGISILLFVIGVGIVAFARRNQGR